MPVDLIGYGHIRDLLIRLITPFKPFSMCIDTLIRWSLISGLFSCLLVAPGCAGGVKDKPLTVPVSGKVSLDGQPLAGARLLLTPTTPGLNPSTGVTDSQGTFNLMQGPNNGASPGAYKVTIESYVMQDGSPVATGPGMDVEQLKMQGKVKPALPAKYSDPAQTELKADITDKGTSALDFTLTSK